MTALQQVIDQNSSWAEVQQVNIFDEENEWVYFVIESQIGIVSFYSRHVSVPGSEELTYAP